MNEFEKNEIYRNFFHQFQGSLSVYEDKEQKVKDKTFISVVTKTFKELEKELNKIDETKNPAK